MLHDACVNRQGRWNGSVVYTNLKFQGSVSTTLESHPRAAQHFVKKWIYCSYNGWNIIAGMTFKLVGIGRLIRATLTMNMSVHLFRTVAGSRENTERWDDISKCHQISAVSFSGCMEMKKSYVPLLAFIPTEVLRNIIWVALKWQLISSTCLN